MKLIDKTNLTAESAALLDAGVTGAPTPGDLWMLSIDRRDLGLVLLGHVEDAYISALPVTLDSADACMGSTVVPAEASPLQTELVVWASAPNSIGTHLLSRRIGSVCSQRDVRNMVFAADGEDIESPFVFSSRMPDDEIMPDVEHLFTSFATFADHDWVSHRPGDAFFDTEALRGAGWNAENVRSTLQLPMSTAAPLFHGEKVPTVEQVDLVMAATGLSEYDVLMPMYVNEALVLSQPEYKTKILNLADRRNVGEEAARNIALQESYALAARQGRGAEMDLARARVTDALMRLLESE